MANARHSIRAHIVHSFGLFISLYLGLYYIQGHPDDAQGNKEFQGVIQQEEYAKRRQAVLYSVMDERY